jgi:hypothetical protein
LYTVTQNSVWHHPLNNPELRNNLELLAKRAFALYNDVLKLNGKSPSTADSLQISMMISGLGYDINRFDEYKTCVSLMRADTKISSLLGKLVGTITGMFTIENAERCIVQFIQQVYLDTANTSFDPTIFNEHYEAFEELFYSDTMRFVDTVRLNNFESEVEEIILEAGLAIKRLPQVQDVQTKMQELRYRPHIHYSRSEFVIERRYTQQKIVGGFAPDPSPEQVERELNKSGDLFDLVIKTLRVLKSSGVYREHGITTETLTFRPYAGISSRISSLENTVLGDKCKLNAQEANELKALYAKTKQANNQTFKIASSRLGFGMERRLDVDKLLDFMIGLESLYLPDGNDELTFRLSLRVAFRVNHDMTERKNLFKFLKKMYGVRSKIAHGKKHELTKEDISKTEQILRQSLKIYLDNPDAFTSDVLDNIYFE